MKMYNATIDVARRKQLSDDQLDSAMEKLTNYHGVIGGSPRGWISAIVSLPAESLTQATLSAVAVVESALGFQAIAAEVMTSEEFDLRQGFEPMPDLVSVSEAADLLGVSRQRVLQRIEAKTLPATRVGRDWVIARVAVDNESDGA